MLTLAGRHLLALTDLPCPVLYLSPCSYAQALAWMISPDLLFPGPLLRVGPLFPRTAHLSAPLALVFPLPAFMNADASFTCFGSFGKSIYLLSIYLII